jgi:serine/threonine-protein kinase
MSAHQSLSDGVVVAGRYRIERALGEGGMATVYAVRHVHTGEQLAMKLLRSGAIGEPRAVELFRREMRAPAQIGSEHVVRVTDADVADELGNTPFLVMEFLRGRDLERELASRGKLPADEALLYLTQAARALDKAHKMGIVHRDLKPENLFLSRREDGSPWLKILDFGIAKIDPSSVTDLGAIATTATGEVFGTPLYMAPEQARGQNDKVGPWSDIWAIGVIAHKLLTGRDAWTPKSMAHLVSLVAYEPIAPPSSRGVALGPAFDEWFLRCCARDPDGRFASAGEAVDALAEALQVSPADPAALRRSESEWEGHKLPSAPLPGSEATTLSDPGAAPMEEEREGPSPLSRTRMDPPARPRAGWALLAGFVLVLMLAGAGIAALRGTDREPALVALPRLRPAMTIASAAAGAALDAAAAEPPVELSAPAPARTQGAPRPAATTAKPPARTAQPPSRGKTRTKTKTKKSGDPQLDVRD